jgi:hypothetical protein
LTKKNENIKITKLYSDIKYQKKLSYNYLYLDNGASRGGGRGSPFPVDSTS